MSHVSYWDTIPASAAASDKIWVKSQMNESCLIWMSHVSYWDTQPASAAASDKACNPAVVWVSATPILNESCQIRHLSNSWVMSHIKAQYILRHNTCIGSSKRQEPSQVLYEWVTSHMNESCLILRHNTCIGSSKGQELQSRSCVSERDPHTEWVMSHVSERAMSYCCEWVRLRVSEWAMSHMNAMSYVTHEWTHHVVFRWMSPVTCQ